MEQKIQELTDKIYREGIEKAEEKAEQLVKDAEKKASKIISNAREEAEKILAEARNQAAELKRNTEAEIKLSSQQALSAIKQQILNMVTAKVIEDSTTKTLSDPSVVKDFVSEIVKNWKSDASEVQNIEVLLPPGKQNELKKVFEKGSSDLLKKGVKLNFSNNIKAGFRIGPVEESYRISLTDEDFHELFKEYLRPKTREYLFGE